MACPHFDPVEKMAPGDWIHEPRLPLIDAYRGVCRAAGPFEPEESVQRELCNWGCARGRCERLPEGADAVRFSVAASEAAVLRIVYILEKDCVPLEHGVIEYTGSGGATILEKQARAFAESYLSRMDHFQSSRGGENVSMAMESSSAAAE